MEKNGIARMVWAGAICLAAAGLGYGVVLHPGDLQPANHPDSRVVGRWNDNASGVAISPNYILTVRHQGYGVGSTIYFDGQPYTIQQVWTEPATDGAEADLRVCRISKPGGSPANLPVHADIYTGNPFNKAIVLGGFGKGRGADVLAGSTVIGYNWALTDNSAFRWGSNNTGPSQQEQDITAHSNFGDFTSTCLTLDFDGPSPGSTEGAVAEYDSGGGWFYQDGTTWKLVGISAYTDNGGTKRSIFAPTPEKNYALKVADYAAWINVVVVEPSCPVHPAGDLDGDCRVNLADLTIMAQRWLATCAGPDWCDGADIGHNGMVNLADFSAMASTWLACSWVPAWGCN